MRYYIMGGMGEIQKNDIQLSSNEDKLLIDQLEQPQAACRFPASSGSKLNTKSLTWADHNWPDMSL